MRALFCTTDTVDCANHVRAWDSFSPIPAVHLTFNYRGLRNDWLLSEMAHAMEPDVIFYIGAVAGRGTPHPSTFHALREVAPTINLVSDAADSPWHPVVERYRRLECFDLQVAIDGAGICDLATLTPVDPSPFGSAEKIHRCGFSGSFTKGDMRGRVISPLVRSGHVVLRRRGSSYEEHAAFMSSCRMVINTPFCGTGKSGHVKGRVLEAGWAGCGLLELSDSPVFQWFPREAVLGYKDGEDAFRMIRSLSDAEIANAAEALSACVRDRYTPQKIYGEMLERVGLDVGASVKRSAA